MGFKLQLEDDDLKQHFLEKSEDKAHDLRHKQIINFNIDKYNNAVQKGKLQFADLELARKHAKNIKWQAIEQLDKQLELFEANMLQNGGKVLWAATANEACKMIADICIAKDAKLVVKSKSMVTEEIHINEFLSNYNIESIETDLGEYIQQLDGEPPYHIVTPAMHKSKEDIAALFHKKLGTAPNLNPSELTLIAREKLRKKYAAAKVGITGANFLVADVGGVCVTENEGNARLSTSLPETHIVVAGIEKIIPAMQDLGLYWPLLSTYGTGQQLTVYNTLFTGPRKQGENDGPIELYVILLDNGRTNLLQKEVRESMYCIRCGSCLNACPVYKNIGGHTYNATYSGPIGSVITPHMKSMGQYGHLSFASSLCGNCTEVCPIKINIHEMLLENRQTFIANGHGSISEKMGWKVFKGSVMHRLFLNFPNKQLKGWGFKKFFSKAWGSRRDAVQFPSKNFNQIWRQNNKK